MNGHEWTILNSVGATWVLDGVLHFPIHNIYPGHDVQPPTKVMNLLTLPLLPKHLQ